MPHNRDRFEKDLDQMKQDVLRMASLAQKNLQDAVQGLLERNSDLCNLVIVEDDEVDQLEKKIDLTVVDLIVKYPLSSANLRRVLSTMKVGQQLERISDEAVNIAKRARKINTHSEFPEITLVQTISDLAIGLVRDSIVSYNEGDVGKALTLDRRNGVLNQQHGEFVKRMIDRTKVDPSHLKDYVDLMFVVRFLERVGDHAVNIGEDTVYSETAFDIRHGGEHPCLS